MTSFAHVHHVRCFFTGGHSCAVQLVQWFVAFVAQVDGQLQVAFLRLLPGLDLTTRVGQVQHLQMLSLASDNCVSFAKLLVAMYSSAKVHALPDSKDSSRRDDEDDDDDADSARKHQSQLQLQYLPLPSQSQSQPQSQSQSQSQPAPSQSRVASFLANSFTMPTRTGAVQCLLLTQS